MEIDFSFPPPRRWREAAFILVLVTAVVVATSPAHAQSYPNRPIRVIVPFSPGGAVDGPMRLIAQELSKRLGQGVIVENKHGAGATNGSAVVAEGGAAGYRLLHA